MVAVLGRSCSVWKEKSVKEDRKKFMISKSLEKKLLHGLLLPLLCLLVLSFLLGSSTRSWDLIEVGGDNCVRKQGGQETFEWLCAKDGVIFLAQSDNIKNCYTCFLKKFSDWTWEQEIRKGIRESPKYITCRRYKRKKARNGQEVCLYKGANDTYTLVVEGQCPVEFRCKYEPHGKEPNIDSVLDSLNDSFKK